ncbi:sulfotransferase [Isoptericola jiangsuensis]|uniref:sulfotransferase n=1 Tax=Isoptericola jiangsuensis TaxID=548579 RepID=UPI003AAEA92C
MVNPRNVTSPVSLVAHGRSGTTFITNVFRRHPDFRAIGETANTVFATYRSLETSLPWTGPIRGRRPVEDASRDAVHAMLFELFGANMPRWFHKPIVVPTVTLSDEFPTHAEFCTWYWETFDRLFPDGMTFTVVRDPAETARSSMIRWGGTLVETYARMERAFELVLHPRSRVAHVLEFEALQSDPERFIRDLLAIADARFDQACLTAIDGRFAVNPKSSLPAPEWVAPRVAALYDELRSRAIRPL